MATEWFNLKKFDVTCLIILIILGMRANFSNSLSASRILDI